MFERCVFASLYARPWFISAVVFPNASVRLKITTQPHTNRQQFKTYPWRPLNLIGRLGGVMPWPDFAVKDTAPVTASWPLECGRIRLSNQSWYTFEW
jgi:hypothetical protein